MVVVKPKLSEAILLKRCMKVLGDILGRDPGIQSGLTPGTTQWKNINNKVLFLRRFAACRQKFGVNAVFVSTS